MKHTLEQNKLTIYLEGELNSSNSEEKRNRKYRQCKQISVSCFGF